MTLPGPGDEIDNDCDGNIDEEIQDQRDNDGDGLIDEDFKEVGVLGFYGSITDKPMHHQLLKMQ